MNLSLSLSLSLTLLNINSEHTDSRIHRKHSAFVVVLICHQLSAYMHTCIYKYIVAFHDDGLPSFIRGNLQYWQWRFLSCNRTSEFNTKHGHSTYM